MAKEKRNLLIIAIAILAAVLVATVTLSTGAASAAVVETPTGGGELGTEVDEDIDTDDSLSYSTSGGEQSGILSTNETQAEIIAKCYNATTNAYEIRTYEQLTRYAH